jgi:hypothetical protein
LSADQLRQLLAGIRRGVLRQPPVVEAAMATATQALLRSLAATLEAIAKLETALDTHFAQHPDAAIVRSLPGLGLNRSGDSHGWLAHPLGLLPIPDQRPRKTIGRLARLDPHPE